MSANFLDISGLFVGADLHLYFPGPAPAPPVPNLHVVGSLHILPQNRPWRMVGSVTSGHCWMLQSNWAMLIIPHVPIPIPPFPVAEGPNLACVIITASSAPQLSAHSVTGKGEALLTALVGPMGLNTDCGIQFLPTGVDVNLNSVKTSPSLGDYYAASVSMALNGFYNQGASLIPKNSWCYALAFAQNLADLTGVSVFDPIAWVIGKVTSAVQSRVDS